MTDSQSLQSATHPPYPYPECTDELTFHKSSVQCNRLGLLSLPAELITLVAIHVTANRLHSRTQSSCTPHRMHRNRRAAKLSYLDFKDLVNLGMSCRYLHTICQRLYQKQMVMMIPSTNQSLCEARYLPRFCHPRYQRKTIGDCNELYTRTIEEHEKVANGWPGVRNVNWLFISNQAYHRPKRSELFHGLITSTARLVKAFTNLRYLSLSRVNDETILMCLEQGVGENLEALSITLSETDDSDKGIVNFEQRISAISSLSRLKAIQINDIEPTWTGLIDQTLNLEELSLHISSFNSSIISSLKTKPLLKTLEIFGGLRCPSSGKRLMGAIANVFPMVDVLTLGIHFQVTHDVQRLETVDDYLELLSKLVGLKRFVFNHANLTTRPQFSGFEDSQLDRFFDYSRPYFEQCNKLQELVSIDFCDRSSTHGIMAKKIDFVSSNHRMKEDKHSTENLEQATSLNQKWQIMTTVEGKSTCVPITMCKIPDVRERIMVPFEFRWIRLVG
ncbi:hypothetical protein CROQUDRAFT_53777 [Cronartium quercuum f. sp. fusiforme G11]|uniref:F-box domain-containing protein n=1 Tax=Cronartium quercuum f. sp. fusiforme G11 TaxID=708437 RepID=A0A9P6T752_9BASI|nr:hypothetical protein CROQUDRAFT_53777 [Cronartium quercuum f. sp. fusiforme G11]